MRRDGSIKSNRFVSLQPMPRIEHCIAMLDAFRFPTKLESDPVGWALGRVGRPSMTQANPHRGFVSSFSPDDFEALSSAVAGCECRDRCGFGAFDEAAAPYRPHPSCLSCGFPDTGRAGSFGQRIWQCDKRG